MCTLVRYAVTKSSLWDEKYGEMLLVAHWCGGCGANGDGSWPGGHSHLPSPNDYKTGSI